MKLVVTGATGFLGSRTTSILRERGHEVVALARPGGAARAATEDLAVERADAGDPGTRRYLAGSDAVLHFAGVPDPARARSDPARAVRENAGATLNLLEGCLAHGAALVYPSTLRAAVDPPPDAYALSKRLGEETCQMHPAPATVVRLPSVFGPGQVAAEGATGAIASFAARALAGEPIVVEGDPERARDFLYVDDFVLALERIVRDARWNETLTVATGAATPLRRAAELVRDAAGNDVPIETRGGTLAPGENESYVGEPALGFPIRPLEEAVPLYVDWLRTLRVNG